MTRATCIWQMGQRGRRRLSPAPARFLIFELLSLSPLSRSLEKAIWSSVRNEGVTWDAHARWWSVFKVSDIGKKENGGDGGEGTIRACDSFVLAFVGGAGNMGRWRGPLIEHVRRKTTRLWKKTGKSQKTGAYLPFLVVYCKNKVMMLKITLEKRQNSLTIL